MKVISTGTFLGPARFHVWLTLNGSELAPVSVTSEGSAAAGESVFQLASREIHSSSSMTVLRKFVASRVYEFVSPVFDLPRPEELAVQLFPVRMKGRRDNAPHQRPHRDGFALNPGRYVRPIVTAVYFLDCHELAGGELILYDRNDNLCAFEILAVIRPTTDSLVAMSGDIYHSVKPLINGSRTSIVTNFYADAPGLDEAARQAVHNRDIDEHPGTRG
jgi:2OG-Fe(II) oxygenase superfamily